MLRYVIRPLFCFAFAFVCWVGSAQLGVAAFGPENSVIVLIAVVGLFAGIGAAFSLWRLPFWQRRLLFVDLEETYCDGCKRFSRGNICPYC